MSIMSRRGTDPQTVYMLVDLKQVAPVGGPYLNLEHSRDAWGWLVTPDAKLSHLRLVVRDREDLVTQVQAWREWYLRRRQQLELQRIQDRQLTRPCRGCG